MLEALQSSQSLLSAAYLSAAVLFILSLGGLASQETARRGNLYGMLGMAIALGATVLDERVQAFELMIGAVVVGAAIGTALAARVVMTAMPQLVAMLHSFVGLAAVLVGISTYLAPGEVPEGEHIVHLIEIWLGVSIGAITFTGSVIAWAKLRGSMSGRPWLIPGRHALNGTLVLALIVMAIPFCQGHDADLLTLLLINAAISCFLGVHLVAAIGGADMPVVVSLLNSYSGWAAAAAGFMLKNDLLLVTGALVGSSGAILSIIMCRAMNRSILNVVFGGFGTDGGTPKPTGDAAVDQGEVTETNAAALASGLKKAKRVVIVPGYGMAVARAQHVVKELTELLRKSEANVQYAIHPVAGRLPGHMNVLLAEAGVPYDIVFEMDEIQDELGDADFVLVIGANDIVNPSAETDETSPIYGMPVIQAWNADTVVVFKRGMGSGYAGVQNPLFFLENTRMLFGDARDSIQDVVSALRG